MATRKITNKLIEMMEEGALDPETLARACMAYMSESEVADMAHDNEFLTDEDEDEDEEDADDIEEVSFNDEELY